jgi:UDP-N-acetylmuramoyl-tripeptide--D-alanyl-D-alanine ligase
MEIILAILWTIPAILRVWRVARFYQIEEYMTDRFLRWLGGRRERWFPRQPAIMMLAGVILSAVLQIARVDAVWLHMLIWLAVGGVVSLPEPVKETKKAFVRTPRATLLLGVSFTLIALFVLGWSFLAVESDSPAGLSTVAILGFIAFLFSPLMLPLANLLLYPVEKVSSRRILARAHQRLLAVNATTIGITGSYGKTSTKTYLAHILGGRHRVYATPKSYNTLMGIGMAINSDLDPNFGFEYFIAEMGAYVPGEIAAICRLVQPQISLVTAVGPMHLERFRTIENTAQAKYEIIQGLPKDGLGVFNGDDPRVLAMAERGYPDHRIIISREGLPQARIQAQNIQQSLEGLTFEVYDSETDETQPFKTRLIGLHNVTNILMATAVARHLGLPLAEIGMRVATLEAAEHRLRVNVLPNGVVVIDDAYSANPVGAVSALEVLKLHTSGRRILITPGMVELGSLQETENYQLGQRAAEAATDIILVGIQQTQAIQRGIADTDFDKNRLQVVDTFEEARQWFQQEVKNGDTVLFLNDLPDTYL